MSVQENAIKPRFSSKEEFAKFYLDANPFRFDGDDLYLVDDKGEDLIQVGEVLPCGCGDPICRGWQVDLAKINERRFQEYKKKQQEEQDRLANSRPNRVCTHQTHHGWVVSVNEVWLPGVYDLEETARLAVDLDDKTLSELNLICRVDGQNRLITQKDFPTCP